MLYLLVVAYVLVIALTWVLIHHHISMQHLTKEQDALDKEDQF